MSREDTYIKQLQALEIYDPAFDPAIKNLARLERELTRAQKEWSEEAKKAGLKRPSFKSKIYPVIQNLRSEIERSRESLGLTPKGLHRIKGTYWTWSGRNTPYDRQPATADPRRAEAIHHLRAGSCGAHGGLCQRAGPVAA